jgi:hypothetical protein
MLGSLLAIAMGQTSTSSVGPLIPANDPNLQYTGRIDFDDSAAPVFCYGGCSFRTRFEGTTLALKWSQGEKGGNNSIGVRIDGGDEIRFVLAPKGDAVYQVAVGLKKKTHDLLVYRRSDVWEGMCSFQGLILDKGCGLLPPPPRPDRRIEFYGDSVTAGTLVEAVGFEGLSDEHITTYQGQELTNAYWSYAFIAARKLNAEAQIVAAGGLALHDKNGWWPIGLESIYDKVEATPDHLKPWDFNRFHPQVVVIAIGQNDARFENIHDNAVRAKWITDYNGLLDHLRSHYPNAWFVLATTVLGHDLAWDDALKQIAESRKDKVRYYRYRRAGKATAGHPRLPEHQEMADELARFIGKLPDVWKD